MAGKNREIQHNSFTKYRKKKKKKSPPLIPQANLLRDLQQTPRNYRKIFKSRNLHNLIVKKKQQDDTEISFTCINA